MGTDASVRVERVGRAALAKIDLATRHRKGLFADLDPPQLLHLRADEILGNERQMVRRSGRALQA
jgi:hypothetical protein